MRVFFILLFLLLAGPAPALAKEAFPTLTGSGRALAGDQVAVNGQVVKLWGIDAPDKGQQCRDKRGASYDCHQAALNALSALIGQNQITCYLRGQDRNSQKVGTCGVNGYDLAALMVRSGWALAYISMSAQYAGLEAQAQAARRGAWSGRIEAPWQWRSQQKPSK